MTIVEEDEEFRMNKLVAQAKLSEVTYLIDLLTQRKMELASVLSGPPPAPVKTYGDLLDDLDAWRLNTAKTTEYIRMEDILKADKKVHDFVRQQPKWFNSSRYKHKKTDDGGALFRWKL